MHHGKVVASNFLSRLHRQSDFHEKLLAKVDELRGGPLSDASRLFFETGIADAPLPSGCV